MAITFPNNPTVGQQWEAENGYTYEYDGEKWSTLPDSEGQIPLGGDQGQVLTKINSTDYNMEWADVAPPTIISSTAPTGDIIDGQLWWKDDTGSLFIYYGDGNSSQWVETSSPDAVSGGGISEAPDDGQQYARQSEQWSVVEGFPEAPTDGQLYARQNSGWSVVEGGDNSVTYSGASAWGNVAAIGTLNGGLNIASVTRQSAGVYTMVFATPMPDANYSVVAALNRGDSIATGFRTQVAYQSATQFTIYTVRLDYTNGATVYSDDGFNFAVHSQNALPPAGTAGTDAWGFFDGSSGIADSARLLGSYNISSVTRTAMGEYSVVFTNPMPTANYAVTVGGNSSSVLVSGSGKTTSGFSIVTRDASNNPVDPASINFTVNATNANLPYTFTKEQIEAAINNTGSYAWGACVSGGSLAAGNNCQTQLVTTGIYQVTFNTPLPDANYAVSGTAESGVNDVGLQLLNNGTYPKTANSFYVAIFNESSASYQNGAFNFTVTAAKGQPLSLGGGADAWGQVSFDGTLNGRFNCTVSTTVKPDGTVVAAATGVRYVTFDTPMPSSQYSVATGNAGLAGGGNWDVTAANKSAEGFTIWVNAGAGGPTDQGFDFAVFATDGNAGGFWARTNDGALTPANSTDDVQIASLNSGQLAGFRNQIINGDFRIWQRGTNFDATVAAGYTADRWSKGALTNSIQKSSFFSSGSVASYGVYMVDTTGQSRLTQAIELPEAGQPGQFTANSVWTLSWYELTANQPLSVQVNWADDSANTNTVLHTVGTIQSIGTVGSLTRKSCQVTITGTIAATSRCLNVGLLTVGANQAQQVYQVQFEPGSVATPFERRPIGTELLLCQRYYQTTVADQKGYNGNGNNVTFYSNVDYKVVMRTTPSASFNSTSTTNVSNTYVDNVNSMACLKGCLVAATGSYVSAGILTLDAEL